MAPVIAFIVLALAFFAAGCRTNVVHTMPVDRQITFAPHGHVLTNTAVWSPDSRRIVYDIRPDIEGSVFEGDRIETVDVPSGEVAVLYQSQFNSNCGVATYHPSLDRVVFIQGPEHPTADWTYGASRRQGVMVDAVRPEVATALDARDMTPPFTHGALRGGSHVHVFSGDGALVSFTYEDEVLSQFETPGDDHDVNQRNVGVSLIGRPVRTDPQHRRNQDGSAFSVLVTRTTANPKPGSDQYSRAYEDGWVGRAGYRRADGRTQRYAIAFLGDVIAENGQKLTEVFVADLPEDLTEAGERPLAGTPSRLPYPPAGTTTRRLTRTADRRYSGVQGVRHWVRSSPDGSRLAFLMKNDTGVSQIWTVSPQGGEPTQVTHNAYDIGSAFTWSADGRSIAYVMDRSVCITDVSSADTRRLTPRAADAADSPLPLACVFSPDSSKIAYLRNVRHSDGERYNQIFVVSVD